MPPKAAKSKAKTPAPAKKEPEPRPVPEEESGSEDEEMEDVSSAQNANQPEEEDGFESEGDDEDEENEENPAMQSNVQKAEPKKRGRKKLVDSSSKSSKKPNKKESYSRYIYKVLKQVHPDVRISGKSMNIMNNFVQDIFERIATESSNLSHLTKKSTMTSRDINTATRLILPGELARHAENEGKKSLHQYLTTTENEKSQKKEQPKKKVPKK